MLLPQPWPRRHSVLREMRTRGHCSEFFLKRNGFMAVKCVLPFLALMVYKGSLLYKMMVCVCVRV